MSLELRRRMDLTAPQIAGLESAMAAFYSDPPPTYYQIADESTGNYNAKERPFHCDLVDRVRAGDSVLELGCGTAHLCPHVEARGARYTGVDHSESLLDQNRRRFPNASFRRIGLPIEQTFDVVASLYTIEHIVDPPAYLQLMWQYCRPGGLLAIICPEFVAGRDFPPSFFFGKTPRRFREKVRSLSLVDASEHLLDLKIRAPRWKKQAQRSAPGAFWINLRPRILHGASYSIDADAVHLVTQSDLVWYFKEKGATIVQTSKDMTGISPDILRYNGYVLARKGHG